MPCYCTYIISLWLLLSYLNTSTSNIHVIKQYTIIVGPMYHYYCSCALNLCFERGLTWLYNARKSRKYLVRLMHSIISDLVRMRPHHMSYIDILS